MKVRLDYVTNSSSSSFLIARKEDLTEKQKSQVIEAVEKILGEKVAGTEDELRRYFEDCYEMEFNESGEPSEDAWHYGDYIDARNAIRKGLSVYQGDVSFEGDDQMLIDLYDDLFDALSDGENYIGIDTSLDY